ncbi:MAG: DedA family protein [Gammaproteobacteria bacterium]|nr:DedA family protein [Gammaproteobacteria bacterium]
MLYLTMFTSAFLAATIVPFASEIALTGALAAGGAVHWLVLVATLGNTLGAVINWALGRFIERFRDRRWFPASPQQIERAQAWFQRYGIWSLLFAWLPVVGEPLTVVAGAMRVHIAPFLILVAIGKGLRYVVLALAVEGVVTP